MIFGFFPLLIVGFVLLSIFLTVSKRKRQTEEMQKAKAEQQAKAQAVPAHRPAAEPKKTVAPTYREPTASASGRATYSAAAAEASYSAAKQKRPAPEPEEALQQSPVWNWNSESALQGIVYAEILGKPKALRK